MTQGNLGKSDLLTDFTHPLFMVTIAITVYKSHGYCTNAGFECRLKVGPDPVLIQWRQHVTAGINTFIDLNHAVIKQARQHDIEFKQARTVLVADAQGITEAPGGDKQGAFTPAFQQRIGCDGSPHLDVFNGVRGYGGSRRQAKHITNALDCRVLVAPRILGEQLMAD